jgi:hypothetical protein
MKKIVGIAGFIGAGKDAAAKVLVDNYGFRKIAFADSLKDSVAAIFSWDRNLLEGISDDSREWRERRDPWWSERLGVPHLTPRWVLANLATNVLREYFHPDIWTASVERKIIASEQGVVITDCRFTNELDAIKRIGGVTVRVYRGQDPPWVELAKTDMGEFRRQYPQVHESEYSALGYNYDYHLDNNSTLEHLHAQLAALVVN